MATRIEHKGYIIENCPEYFDNCNYIFYMDIPDCNPEFSETIEEAIDLIYEMINAEYGKKNKHGGSRTGAGAKKKKESEKKEKTKTMRIPVSKIDEVKTIIHKKLKP